MSGIAGMVRWSGGPVDRALVERMKSHTPEQVCQGLLVLGVVA